MAYTIVKTDGTILTTIPDGTINVDSTSLGLPGRFYAGYGQSVDTNFVHMLENFANSTPPQNPLRGQIWYNTNNNLLYVCPQDGETNQNSWIQLAVTSTTATSTFGGVIVTGNLEANNIVANNAIEGNSITVNYANVNVSATMSSANIVGNANIGNTITQVITTGSPTTTGAMTGTWTVTGGAVGNTMIVNGGNLYVTSGIIASSFTFPNGTPISPTGGYTNQNVNEYLQGTGNITIANRFQGNIFPTYVYTGNGTASNPSYTANADTNTGMYFPAADTLGFSLGGSDKVRINSTGVGIGTNNPSQALTVVGTGNITGNVVLGGTLSVTGNTTLAANLSVNGSANIGSLLNVSGNLSVSGTTSVSNINITSSPRFYAFRNAGDITSGSTIVFDTEVYDNDNNYNTTTGIFTAPVAGVYLFTVAAYVQVASGIICSFVIQANRSPLVTGSNPVFGFNGIQSQIGSSERSITGSFVLTLNQNDQISIESLPAMSSNISIRNGLGTFFSGAKIA